MFKTKMFNYCFKICIYNFEKNEEKDFLIILIDID